MLIEKLGNEKVSLEETIRNIYQRIDQALVRSPYGKRQVTLMGVSKGQPMTLVQEAARAGLLDLGENYAQELLAKAPLFQDMKVRWHFIGKLQSNKIKFILPHVSAIHSLDSLEHGERISRMRDQLSAPRPPVPVLIQLNLGNDMHRAGLQPAIVEEMFLRFCGISGISVVGLMCLPPFARTSKQTRAYFKMTKELFDQLRQKHPKPEQFSVLSMGMSRDFEEAIEEGSTCVRIGEGIFGPRLTKEKD